MHERDLLPVSCSSFLTQRPMQTLKEKLCTEHLSQSLSQILEYRKYLILEYFLGFFWPHYVAKQWSLFILSRVTLLQKLAPNYSSSWALQTSRVWLKILLRSQSTILLWRENKVIYTNLCWLLLRDIIQFGLLLI